MRLKWTSLAINDFEQQHDYIAEENPQAAQQIAQRIWDEAQRLTDYPYIGRVGEDEATREWVVSDTSYLLVYRINKDSVEILRVWHFGQNRQK